MKSIIIFLTTLLFSILPAHSKSTDYKTYYGRITKIVDGDTLHASVKIWPEIEGKFKIRIKDLNTPEMRKTANCPNLKAWAVKAKERVQELFPLNSRVKIENVSKGKFGRYIADVSRFHKGEWFSLRDTLINERLGIPYDKKMTSENWCEEARKLYE